MSYLHKIEGLEVHEVFDDFRAELGIDAPVAAGSRRQPRVLLGLKNNTRLHDKQNAS